MKIIPATAESLNIIRDLAYRTWPSTFGNILSREQICYMLDNMYDPQVLLHNLRHNNHLFLIACKEEEAPVGFASYELNYEPERCKLHKIYILPEAQGAGVGTALMDRVKTLAQSGNQSALLLNVNRHNPAVRFYESCGFHILHEEDIDIGAGFFMNDFVMELKLDTR